MHEDHAKLPSSAREAFEQYIIELEQEFLPWYTRASNINKWWWVVGQCVAIVATGATAFVAGLIDKDIFKQYQWLLVLLPLIGAFATSMLAQTRVRDILTLREHGREQMQELIARAKVDFAALKDDAISAAHAKLVSDVGRIEKSQAADVLSLAKKVGQ